jgi:DedD protein
MGLAFWRQDSAAQGGKTRSRNRKDETSNADRSDPAQQMRARARRRLIGAAALLLAAVIIVPMLLDPAPKPLPGNIPIDMPSEKSPFKPRIAVPPVPEAGNAPMIPPPDAEAEPKAAKTAPTPEAKSAAADAKAPAAKAPEKSEPAKAAVVGGKVYLQIAALGTESAARDLVARLKKAGHATIVEKVDTKDGARWRVRVGPFATREDAEQARTKLRAAGFQANAVTS